MRNKKKTKKKYKKKRKKIKGGKWGDTCAICRESLIKDTDNLVVITSCKHEFHRKCIKEAMKHNKKCPLCRKEIKYLKYKDRLLVSKAIKKIKKTVKNIKIMKKKIYKSIKKKRSRKIQPETRVSWNQLGDYMRSMREREKSRQRQMSLNERVEQAWNVE